MREKLAAANDTRSTFTGTFVKYGEKSGWKGTTEKTLLLKNIRNSEGIIVTNHLWFNLTKGFEQFTLKEGNVIEFTARVTEYTKGHKGYLKELYNKPIEKDYRLSNPTKIRVVR